MKIKRVLKHLYFLAKERTYKNRIKYIYENNNSKELVISFAAFSDKPCYNYYRTLKNLKSDKLFLQDNFGYLGSYLFFENGSDLPRKLTLELLNQIVSKKNYDRIITLGTSKGGTDAIYYGLEIGATHIYSGANQYFIGKYLNTEKHRKVFHGMMGNGDEVYNQAILDSILPDAIRANKDSNSHIYILYSKMEHTYYDDIIYMLSDLSKTNINYTEIIEEFEDHNDVGKFFIPFIQESLIFTKNE